MKSSLTPIQSYGRLLGDGAANQVRIPLQLSLSTSRSATTAIRARSGRCRTVRRTGKFDPKATIEIYPMNGRKARESGLSDMLHPSRVLLWPSGAVCGAGGVGRGPEARPQFLDRAQAPNLPFKNPADFERQLEGLRKAGAAASCAKLAAMRARPRGKKTADTPSQVC